MRRGEEKKEEEKEEAEEGNGMEWKGRRMDGTEEIEKKGGQIGRVRADSAAYVLVG